ncbi:hypothetical protein Scep_030301 [Stephania cephalantha]|uniref:Uncharacterized protein n=1 Tax=Stephania cephalantha TaxID=152367 RepID=A0AAP0DZA8_9MAGN
MADKDRKQPPSIVTAVTPAATVRQPVGSAATRRNAEELTSDKASDEAAARRRRRARRGCDTMNGAVTRCRHVGCSISSTTRWRVEEKVEEKTTTVQISKRGNLYSKFFLSEVLVNNVHKMEGRWSSVAAAEVDDDESRPSLEKGGSGDGGTSTRSPPDRKLERRGRLTAPPRRTPPRGWLERPTSTGAHQRHPIYGQSFYECDRSWQGEGHCLKSPCFVVLLGVELSPPYLFSDYYGSFKVELGMPDCYLGLFHLSGLSNGLGRATRPYFRGQLPPPPPPSLIRHLPEGCDRLVGWPHGHPSLPFMERAEAATVCRPSSATTTGDYRCPN